MNRLKIIRFSNSPVQPIAFLPLWNFIPRSLRNPRYWCSCWWHQNIPLKSNARLGYLYCNILWDLYETLSCAITRHMTTTIPLMTHCSISYFNAKLLSNQNLQCKICLPTHGSYWRSKILFWWTRVLSKTWDYSCGMNITALGFINFLCGYLLIFPLHQRESWNKSK